MTNSSVLNPDEKRLVSYFASRVIMSFGEAQELRSAIARRYAFEDQRLIHFAQELLRRSGLSDSSQPPSDHTGQDFSKVQQDFLGRSGADGAPGFD